jgi:flagellar protein FlgJ
MFASSIASSLASPLASSTTTLSPQQMAQTKASAQQFEGVFLSEMMSHMFQDVKTDPEFGGGQGEDMFKSLLTNEYGKQMAANGGIGIADQLQKEMIKIQQQKG